MSEQSARFALPFLAAGQAQKEIFHNEALIVTDMLLHPVAQGVADMPPEAPAVGDCWIVGADAGGAWAGHAGALAGWTGGGWRYAAPQPGMMVWRADRAAAVRYREGAWGDAEAIAAPSGGPVIDGEARAAIGALIVALRTQGLIRE